MTKFEVIGTLAKDGAVERIVKKTGLHTPYASDLCQDIYEALLLKDENLIVGMWCRGEIEYYIRKMCKNNINSTTSPFYKDYEKFRKTTSDLDNEKTEGEY